MMILAIETSCDETAIAVVEFSGPKSRPAIRVLSNLVSSQAKLHAKYGGVVPNFAKREHQRNLAPLLLTALKEAKLLEISNFQFPISKQISKSKLQKLEKILEREPELLKRFKNKILTLKTPPINAIAVTHGPGLAPALWVGINFAKALAFLWKKPLIPVNHMEGHLYSAFLQKSGIENFQFPALALLVSGGHTELVLMKRHGKYQIIGETLDDAAGEAFDKVARILGLGYPGGREISRVASNAGSNVVSKKLSILYATACKMDSSIHLPNSIHLPRPMINSKDYNFSFSGLKTAVFYLVRDLGPQKTEKLRSFIAKDFQEAVVEVLVKKTIRAAKEYKVKIMLLSGGVAANKLLREKLGAAFKEKLSHIPHFSCLTPLCGDNALMIALAAHFSGKRVAPNSVGADANLRLN